MQEIPHVLLVEILTFLPRKSFLPYAHVSTSFKRAWEVLIALGQDEVNCLTAPFLVGNLFASPWYKDDSRLNTSLLGYYLLCGWQCNAQRLMKAVISRGDLSGGKFLVEHYNNKILLDQREYCATAAAAGHVNVLRWLIEQHQCPYDTEEIFTEARENAHVEVLQYIEHLLRKSRGT